MPVTLSIKNVPDKVARRLREQAERNHRSLQGELLSLVERAAEAKPFVDQHLSRQPLIASQSESALMIQNDRDGRSFTVEDLYDWAKAQGFRGTGDSTEDIRRMRDERGDHIEKVIELANARHSRKARAKSSGRR